MYISIYIHICVYILVYILCMYIYIYMRHAVAHLVEALSYKFAGSIPDGCSGIFHSYNPSGRTMALGSTQPLI